MTEVDMMALLEQAMNLKGQIIWVEFEKENTEGYRMFTGSIVEFPGTGTPLHRYVVAANPNAQETARGTYTGIKDNVILHLPTENAWTLFREAIEYLKKS